MLLEGKDEQARQRWQFELYERPLMTAGTAERPPPGFDEADEMAGFHAAAAAR